LEPIVFLGDLANGLKILWGTCFEKLRGTCGDRVGVEELGPICLGQSISMVNLGAFALGNQISLGNLGPLALGNHVSMGNLGKFYLGNHVSMGNLASLWSHRNTQASLGNASLFFWMKSIHDKDLHCKKKLNPRPRT
jgi:hypothetical protein